ncbi:MAG: LacI family DNA-binding transcriptional regulator [Candidatus Devosia phytovorans]|uniref:LacI family DNA-binding transcriptional regulator n=1 Tax=Candidatus Devosia phytovorans TaxID=3121372 RepID=A0AAJ5VWB8_9HYPH|nr:LacI family DNA-binding transcriptional regulator [Devosia sp.]WEK05296.1 MAG: LacI family DNA-binding transcriptional regulator [Devosia sp.]
MNDAKTPARDQRVTIREVALDAGVSVAAVSKVLRDAYGVSDALRAKVRHSMDKLNYRPLASARGMRGRTYTLGLIFPDMRNPFFGDIFAGVNSALERTQYQAMQGIGITVQPLTEAMIDRQMDGIILIGPNEARETLIDIAQRKPLVAIGHHDEEGTLPFDTVNNNDQLGARLVVRHLVGNDFRKIAMFSLTNQPSSVVRQRELGYRMEMIDQGCGDAVNIVRSTQVTRDVQLAIRRLLESPERPEAIFCWTDLMAFEAISVANEMGLRVPDDVAIVGYDNTMFCDFAQNRLTSVDQSGELLGLQAARLLIERVEGRSESEQFIVTPRIVGRNSSRRRITNAD